MATQGDAQRPSYPPPPQDYANYPPAPAPAPASAHDAQRSPHAQPPPPQREESRSAYPPPPDASRQGQYPPPAAYPPPGQWAGQPPAGYPPPPHHYYPYPPRHDLGQPPQPMQPDAYRLPPPYPHYYQYPPPPQAPAPRQRTAIACKYCRKRKIRCSGYDSSPDGRCQNCVRFNQTCLFHPVSSQAAFVPASAVYGPNAGRAPVAGQAGEGAQNGQQQPMLYGAHGQPLGPAGPQGQPAPQYSYPPPPPQGYPPPYSYPPPPGSYPAPAPGSAPHYDAQHQPPPPQHSAPPPQHSPPQQQPPPENRSGAKRGPPDDDPHNEDQVSTQSPHPSNRPRHSYDGRATSSGGGGTGGVANYDYSGQPTSPATSTMSYQSYPPLSATYPNGNQSGRSNNSPPAGHTPQSANGYNSPRAGQTGEKSPPPNQPGSAGSSRSGMKVHEMLGNHNHSEQRARNDNDMLSKLDGKK